MRKLLGRIKTGLLTVRGKLIANTSYVIRSYGKRFKKYAFTDCECVSPAQFEASIIRLYHTIEKGLAYEDYRPGFGRDNIEKLIRSLDQYHDRGYDTDTFFYKTALSCLHAYVKKNKEAGHEDTELEKRIGSLCGEANDCGGSFYYHIPDNTENMTYYEVMHNRHSIRHFAGSPVETDEIKKAIQLAQHTPSACNRQGWRTRIISDRKTIESVLANQNGNRGFGQEIDKLLLVTADLRAQQKSREVFQAFIDGGMYAESILNALFYYGIGSVPLSASLTVLQEKKVRGLLKIDDAEVLIMFIGTGRYPDEKCLTTKSMRKPAEIEVI